MIMDRAFKSLLSEINTFFYFDDGIYSSYYFILEIDMVKVIRRLPVYYYKCHQYKNNLAQYFQISHTIE